MNNFDFKNPDYHDILKKRLSLLRKLREDKFLLYVSKKFYKKNPTDFIQDWMWTIDPRKIELSFIPFILFEKQKEYVLWLYDHYLKRSDGIVEKSRDVGASWLSCAFAVWLFIFYDNHSIGFGSNKEVNVDEIGNQKSLFEKIRILLRNIPEIFLPANWDHIKYMPYMKIINPENGSTIVGEAGVNIGRSGRTTMYFKDESAFYERALLIESALSMNSDVKIDISTPNGIGNVFYKKRFGGEYDVFIFDWRDDPRKDDAWYINQKRKLDSISPVIAASELDRNYFASIEDMCIPYEYIKAAVNLKFDISDTGIIVGGLDVADEGRDFNALIIKQGSTILSINSWKQGNTAQTTRKAYNLCLEHNVEILNYDSIGVGAGVKGEISNIKDRDKEIKTKFYPVNVALPPSSGFFCENRKNSDQFLNLRAELWWKIRRRFEKTYEYVNNKKEHPIDELISIPNNEELIRELSTPKYEIQESGKIKIESKEKMRKRGIKSPNLADALILSFYLKPISEVKMRVI